MKKVEVLLWLEKGCSKEDGEYSIHLKSFSEPLDLDQPGGVDDISLIMDCIANSIDEIELLEETLTCVSLDESGEQEDVFWNKYYVVAGVSHINDV